MASPNPALDLSETASYHQQISNDIMVNGTTTGDVTMANSTISQEAIIDDNRASQTSPDVSAPIASPIQSPITPDEVVQVHLNNGIESSDASLLHPNETTSSQSLSNAQIGESRNIEQIPVETQMQTPAQSRVEIPIDDPGSTVISEPAPAHIQGSTVVTGSRTLAASQSLETVPVQMANNEQGSAARIYINTKVTPVLLEGMKWVAKNEPERPLKWLSDYLAKRSADIEGT